MSPDTEMPKIAFYFNDYVSLAVMLLMTVALIAGQADASYPAVSEAADSSRAVVKQLIGDETTIRRTGYLGDQALKVSVDIVAELPHFRGEGE